MEQENHRFQIAIAFVKPMLTFNSCTNWLLSGHRVFFGLLAITVVEVKKWPYRGEERSNSAE